MIIFLEYFCHKWRIYTYYRLSSFIHRSKYFLFVFIFICHNFVLDSKKNIFFSLLANFTFCRLEWVFFKFDFSNSVRLR